MPEFIFSVEVGNDLFYSKSNKANIIFSRLLSIGKCLCWQENLTRASREKDIFCDDSKSLPRMGWKTMIV